MRRNKQGPAAQQCVASSVVGEISTTRAHGTGTSGGTAVVPGHDVHTSLHGRTNSTLIANTGRLYDTKSPILPCQTRIPYKKHHQNQKHATTYPTPNRSASPSIDCCVNTQQFSSNQSRRFIPKKRSSYHTPHFRRSFFYSISSLTCRGGGRGNMLFSFFMQDFIVHHIIARECSIGDPPRLLPYIAQVIVVFTNSLPRENRDEDRSSRITRLVAVVKKKNNNVYRCIIYICT